MQHDINEQPHLFTLRCDDNAVTSRMLHNFENLGFQHNAATPLLVILGTGRAFALRSLVSLNERPPYVVVATRNQCPEYLDDVWEQAPDILLAGP